MGWTDVKVLLTSLNCHAATSGFHQGLWERQVSRTEWFSDAFNEQHSTHVCFSTHWVNVDYSKRGRDTAGQVKGSVGVKAGVGNGPHTWGGEARSSRADGLGLNVQRHAAYSRGVSVCAGRNGARGRRLQHLRVHHHVKLTWNNDRRKR